jgi:uncharacterized protein YlzI (FlbEa/FlbD family)
MNQDTFKSASNPISESIQAVAQKILEKANTLQSERKTLEQLTLLESSRYKSSQDEEDQYDLIRMDLLQVLRMRHGLELELIQITREEQDVLDRIEKYKEQISIQEKELNEWKEAVEDEMKMMAPHLCKIRLYQMDIEGNLEQKQEMKRKRKEKLDDLLFKHERNVVDVTEYVKELSHIEDEIEIMKDEGKQEDEEIAALGLQIRAMLEKKSALRKVVYEAREKNEIGNERLRLWEEEVLRLRGTI